MQFITAILAFAAAVSAAPALNGRDLATAKPCDPNSWHTPICAPDSVCLINLVNNDLDCVVAPACRGADNTCPSGNSCVSAYNWLGQAGNFCAPTAYLV